MRDERTARDRDEATSAQVPYRPRVVSTPRAVSDLQGAVDAVQRAGSSTSDLPPLSPGAHDAAKAGLVLLRYRARSTHELRERLIAKDLPHEDVEEAMTRLRVWGLLDDGDFAKEWVNGRRRRRGRSAGALSRELEQKGVAPAHIAEALAEVTEDDERDRARDLVRHRLERRPAQGGHRPDAAGERRRLVAFLRRRGFPPGMALGVVDEALDHVD